MMRFLLFASVSLGVTCIAMLRAGNIARKHDLNLRFTTPGALALLVAGVALQIILAAHPAGNMQPLVGAVAIAILTVSAITDAQTGYVFDAITLPALGAIVVLSCLSRSMTPTMAGLAATAGALAALFAATRGRGLGLGDVKLAACVGAALGAIDGLTALGAAFTIGGAYAAYLLVTRRARYGEAVPFAPYIGCGVAMTILYRTFA